MNETVIVRPLTTIEQARAFDDDLQLRRFARVLADAHGLVLSAGVPRSLRRELAAVVDHLDDLLHGGTPHLRPRNNKGPT
jgi:hypothetical protein